MKKLLLSLAVIALFQAVAAGAARASILPDTIGDWMRGAAVPAAVPDQKVWREYGLEDSETAPYTAGKRNFSLSAYRFADATGAFAAFDQIRPAVSKMAAASPGVSKRIRTKSLKLGITCLFSGDTSQSLKN